jgi:hypothetical protein
MSLTDLQLSRVAYHLDFTKPDYLLAIDREVSILNLTPSQELALVGPTPLVSNIYQFEGEDLCSTTSLLGKVEAAYAKIDPSVIDDSLFVSKAGSVELRGSELRKRQSLYRQLVENLAQLVGSSDTPKRVGW